MCDAKHWAARVNWAALIFWGFYGAAIGAGAVVLLHSFLKAFYA